MKKHGWLWLLVLVALYLVFIPSPFQAALKQLFGPKPGQ
jgi:hypothetical protein